MGLLLSVLVACVGAIELFSFFYNVRRNVLSPPVTTELTTIKDNYMKDLHGVRNRIYKDLQKAKNEQYTSQKQVPIVRLCSHEDIELEFNKNIVSRSRSPSPRRFLLTEKDIETSKSGSPSQRQFLVSEEPTGLKKTQSQNSLPEFVVKEQVRENSSPTKRFVLKDPDKVNDSELPIPLPKQFIVTEDEGVSLEPDRSRSPSPIPRRYTIDSDAVFRRSPSPYPSYFDLSAPRNSICSELVDSSIVSVVEVDEDLYKSKSPTPERFDLALESSNFNTTQYWSNKVLVVPQRKSKSRSPSPSGNRVTSHEKQKERSVSPQLNKDVGCLEPLSLDTVGVDDENGNLDDSFLNGLDGIKRGVGSRKSIKKKKSLNTEQNLDKPSTSKQGNTPEIYTDQMLTEAAKELRKLSIDESTNKQEQQETDTKAPEAFWVGKH